MDAASIRRWLESLANAWRHRDPRAASRLFTEAAIYRTQPFRIPLHGRSEIEAYWAESTGNLDDIEVSFGEPLVDGSRVAVEWWALSTEDGRPTTDAGGLFLTFDGDLCAELREYWNLTDEVVAVPEGWGR